MLTLNHDSLDADIERIDLGGGNEVLAKREYPITRLVKTTNELLNSLNLSGFDSPPLGTFIWRAS